LSQPLGNRSETGAGAVFLGNEFIELGIAQNGGFGVATKPLGFYGTSGYPGVAMSVDLDGFGSGQDLAIDYFVPGNPEERWSIGVTQGTSTYWGGFASLNSPIVNGVSLIGQSVSIIADTPPSITSRAKFIGTLLISDGSQLLVEVTHSLEAGKKYFTSEVRITNQGSASIDGLRFMRSFDPDNVRFAGGQFTTTNVVQAQASTEGYSLVSASNGLATYQLAYGEPDFIGYWSDDPRSHVYSGGFTNPNPLDAVADADPTGFTETGDVAIGIVFSTGTLAPGESFETSYRTILSATEASLLLAPKIAVSSNKTALKAGEAATLTFTLSEPSTDFDVSDVTVVNGTISNFAGSGASYTATFVPTSTATAGVLTVESNKFSNSDGLFN